MAFPEKPTTVLDGFEIHHGTGG